MAARLSAFIVWAALAASVVFWSLRLTGGSPTAPAHTVPVSDTMVPRADLNRLFGAPPVAVAQEAPPEHSRFKLIGLAAPREAGGPGVAVIAIESKPPRAYRIGAAVDGDLVLQSVERRSVALGPRGGSATVRLELPVLPAAATGSLAPAASEGGAAAPSDVPASLPPPQAGGLLPEARNQARSAPVPPANLPPYEVQPPPANLPEQAPQGALPAQGMAPPPDAGGPPVQAE